MDSPHWRVQLWDFGDDFQELTAIYQSEPRKRRKGTKGEKRTGDRRTMSDDDARRSAQRAKTRVRRAVVQGRYDSMLTLTFQENLTDMAAAWRYWGKFRRYLARFPWGRQYVIVPELQKRGAIHFHIALRTNGIFMPYNSMIRKWRECIGGLGSVKVSRNHGCREREIPARISSYLSKYITKNFDAGYLNKKRYELSRQHPMPESMEFFLPVGDDTHYLLARMIKHVSGRYPVTCFKPPEGGLIHLRSY